jgi:hypothetical protein
LLEKRTPELKPQIFNSIKMKRQEWLGLLIGCIAAVAADEFASLIVDEDQNLVLVAPAGGENNACIDAIVLFGVSSS